MLFEWTVEDSKSKRDDPYGEIGCVVWVSMRHFREHVSTMCRTKLQRRGHAHATSKLTAVSILSRATSDLAETLAAYCLKVPSATDDTPSLQQLRWNSQILKVHFAFLSLQHSVTRPWTTVPQKRMTRSRRMFPMRASSQWASA